MTSSPPAAMPPDLPSGTHPQRFLWTLAWLYVVSAVLFVALAVHDWRRIGESVDQLARERGQALFNLVSITRDWNARHGGVYVPVRETVEPNPYLEHPLRDQITVEGRALTMVNPAFMTRQIAEIAQEGTGVRFRITSLKPIRPANAADAWETEALQGFERGAVKEMLTFLPAYDLGAGSAPVHRYMAPLLVKPPCMRCHEKQGYQVGDIRGGISVTMPASELLSVRDQRRRASLMILLAGFVIATALLHALALRARRHYRELRVLADRQEMLIAERTRELEERNHALKAEVEERRRRVGELRIAGAVFESAAEAIIVTDADNRIVRVNPAFTAITGYTPVEVIGLDPSLLRSGRHDGKFYAQMWLALQTRGHWEGEIWNRHKNGQVYVEWLSISCIDDEGKHEGKYLAIFHDITRRKETEELLRHKAHHDALTNLPNRALFYDRLQAALSQAHRYRRSFALLLVDLDRFKEVNDTLGHAAGDEVLVEAGRRLSSCVRESDTVARLGGDEFALILSETESDLEAEQVAQRAVELLCEPYYLDAGTARLSGCVGIALYPRHGQDSEQLQRAADIALYAAKAGGRNGYRVYSPHRSGENAQGDLGM